ncbi:MAG: molybdopterin converting factor subunit 1 [Candidatus Binatia bacterium]
MRLRVRLFATLRERAGTAGDVGEFDGPLTVGELWERLRREHRGLAEYRCKIAFAVNQEYVDSAHPLQDNDEVAFIPPVSGGSPSEAKRPEAIDE